MEERILLDVFNFDRLNIYNDYQNGGDGFFDYLPGITIDAQYGRIIFTKKEPFGDYMHTLLGGGNYEQPTTYNPNQEKYVFKNMYSQTKAAALEDSDKNKFQIKGRYKSQGSGGISLGAFNVPRGSVTVRAGGRTLQEGIDYTVNYPAGTVQIMDPSLEASNIPIEVSVENTVIFGQQTRRFTGFNVEHQFNEKFMMGATLLNLSERPLTQKSNFGQESVNNTIFGFNGNYSAELPFLTRLVNKLPNIDTDAPSNISVRGEMAYLLPGSPKNDSFEGETTAYVDDFEGSQTTIDLRSPLAWSMSSVPLEFVPNGQLYGSAPDDPDNLLNGYGRTKMAWYTIDPIFYGPQRPSEISNADISSNATRRIFIDEIFPQVDVAQGQTTIQTTLDLAYFPSSKGPYNNNPNFGSLASDSKWGGIMRGITSTNFEQSNVEYIQFWVMDPYEPGNGNSGGELVFNIGNISEDVLKDGRKQYENGLPGATGNTGVLNTSWGKVPVAQSLVYAFDAEAANRSLQDLGMDGLDDSEEASIYTNNVVESPLDPALDNYQYYLDANGDILTRYLNYNGLQSNSPVQVSNTNRGSTTLPDVEDVNRDNTMNTVNSYYEYRISIKPNMQRTDRYVTDIKEVEVTVPDGGTATTRWIQFKIPIKTPDNSYGGINDLRSISHMRMYLTGFDQNTILRFGTLDLVRGDWRTYTATLQTDLDNPSDDGTYIDVNTVNIIENENRTPIPYRMPPGVLREQLNNNNTIIRQNEQSLSFAVCDLESNDSRAVFKNINVDLRQYKRLKMFVHAEAYKSNFLGDNDLVAFIRIGTDFNQNFYQVEIPLEVTNPGASTSEEIWPASNNFDIPLELLTKLKAVGISNQTLSNIVFYDENLNEVLENAPRETGKMRLAIKGNPSIGNIRSLMIGVKNATNSYVCGEVWFNELRLAELDNKGGWAAIAAVDANVADFATISATGRVSTVGFGSLESMPNQRSREEIKQYDVVTNVNAGQLLPKEWGVQLPVNYGYSRELVTPEFDPLYQDIKLEDRLNAASSGAERKVIRRQAEDLTTRKSINFIGVRKDLGEEQKQRFYNVENFTLNYSYNVLEHRDFEIEELKDQNVRAGFLYAYTFQPTVVEPFKKSDSLFRGKYWRWLKELNFNVLPSSITLNSNITRRFNQQRFRQVYLDGEDPSLQLGLPELQQRNFLFDWQYAINYNLTKSLRFNFTASNNNIVRNYYGEDEFGDRIIRDDLGIWDGFWNVGEPNRHATRLQLNYELPFNKIPFLAFVGGTYSYTGDFDWQRGSDVLAEVANQRINTIQNANTHTLNTNLSLYLTL